MVSKVRWYSLFEDLSSDDADTGVVISVHGANGYLIHQFLDSTSNHRKDKWGGSVINRARFGLEVVKAAMDVFGENVSIKVSPGGGYNDMGYVFYSIVMGRFFADSLRLQDATSGDSRHV